MKNHEQTSRLTLSNRDGVTLIELMVVIVVLGLLAALVYPKVMNPDGPRAEAAKTQIRLFEEALNQFEVENGFYPTTEQGLEALVSKPSTGREPRKYRPGGYMDRIPKDPWENDYKYISPGGHGDFDLYSLGKDGVPGGEGYDADINNWELK